MGENKRDNNGAALLEAAIRKFSGEKFPPRDLSGTRRIPEHSSYPATIYKMLRDRSAGGDQNLFDLSGYTTPHIDEYAALLAEDAAGIDLCECLSSSFYGRIASACADIVGGLWNMPFATGGGAVVPVSDGERAAILSGISALHKWRNGRMRAGESTENPNFVVSEAYNRIWERFSALTGVEMRTVALGADNTMPSEECAQLCDENTIMAVGTINSHATGLDDDIESLSVALDRHKHLTGNAIPIHVDATSGGFIKPFLPSQPKWDFRLPGVVSISATGHHSGLAPFPLGWAAWREASPLPGILAEAELAGSGHAASSFPLPASHVMAQFYAFLRLGRDGFRTIYGECLEAAQYINDRLATMPQFRVLSPALHNPVVVFTMNKDHDSSGLTITGLQAALEKAGWKVAAYKLPESLGSRIAIRLVVRQGVNIDIARLLVDDIKTVADGFGNA